MCVYGVVLINILVLQLGPPKQKFLAPPLPVVCSIRHFHLSITKFDDVAYELTRKELIKRTF